MRIPFNVFFFILIKIVFTQVHLRLISNIGEMQISCGQKKKQNYSVDKYEVLRGHMLTRT